ncbi:MAG: glucose-6-phosphate isomerase, partial [Patescibacteria group bacterium]|nr:glucose-6-phosphate isomerase [Patescibacteria group bacterium]
DVLSSILSKSHIHISTVKGYHLPATVDKNTLVIAVSVSGETDETISVLNESIKTKCKKIVFSKDKTKLESLCNKNGVLHFAPDLYHSPRASFVSFLYYMLDSLGSTLKIKKEDIQDSIKSLQIIRKEIRTSNLDPKNNKALELASWISGTPVIYYPWGLMAAAIRFKNSLNENAKMHAIAEDVIEASHNGIVAWQRPSNFQPILIEGRDDFFKTKERWNILKDFFNSKNIEYKEVKSIEGSILAKLVTLIYLLDYTSIYKAFLMGLDPSPVGPIDFVKNRLKTVEPTKEMM